MWRSVAGVLAVLAFLGLVAYGREALESIQWLPKPTPYPAFVSQDLTTIDGFCTTAPRRLGYIPKECAVRDASGTVTSHNDSFYDSIHCTFHHSDRTITETVIPYDYNRRPAPDPFATWRPGQTKSSEMYCDVSLLH